MKGSATKLIELMEGKEKRYIIPVYQRKYDWKKENCVQLYNDLKKVVQEKRESHFFGSIVSALEGNGSIIEYHIIDGQQRLTTVSLLLLAISNIIDKQNKKITYQTEQINGQKIRDTYLLPKQDQEDDRVKLRPVKSDREAYTKLFGDEKDYDISSNLTINYNEFCKMIAQNEVSIDDLYDAVHKLEIISITLGRTDNAQLIFESLNSTGLALSEGDKIRNYVLMGLKPSKQSQYYEKYWEKIEKFTANDVSNFTRDYLSIKRLKTPSMNAIYPAFKQYAEDGNLPVETLLDDMLRYARYFWKLQQHKSELGENRLDACLHRMGQLDIAVTRPFFMEVFRLNQDNKLTTEDVLRIFLIIENYLFRRNICEVPTNALNKIFLLLNKEVIRYDNTANDYVNKMVYALRSKKESGRFPDDNEFSEALALKQVYLMRGKYKAYLFERFENYGTVETKDVYAHLTANDYTIEHIMPQHLTPAWIESLGANAEEIHATWLHRLANLTLTGYNPSLSNKTFIEKRDAENGYKNSGLKMNQKIAQKDAWGLAELEERNADMVSQALTIWSCPETTFKPIERTLDSCTLDDEDVNLTGRDIARYSFMNMEQPVSSWTDMFELVVKYLHQNDKSVLVGLAYDNSGLSELSKFVSNKENGVRSALKIDTDIYVEKNTSTDLKINILRQLFKLYDADPMELVFYMKDKEEEQGAEEGRYVLRKKYWDYALPLIREQHGLDGAFANVNPISSNTVSGYFGISGFSINCVANYDVARVDFNLAKGNKAQNKAAYDLLLEKKDEIENALGVPLKWERGDQYKASWLSYVLTGVSIANESDWQEMAAFHAEWSKKICDVILPYLKDFDSEGQRLDNIADIVKKWTVSNSEVNENLGKSNRTNIRFTTSAMSQILPDLHDLPSGWNTDNHYFYEIVNRSGISLYIRLSLSARNATPEFLAKCEKINEYYPTKFNKTNWQWRNPFKTKTIEIGEQISKEEIFTGLNECLKEIKQFEADLQSKMSL